MLMFHDDVMRMIFHPIPFTLHGATSICWWFIWVTTRWHNSFVTDDDDDDGADDDDDGGGGGGDADDDEDDRDGFLWLQVVHCYFDNEPIQFIYDPGPPVCAQLSRNFIVKMMVFSRRQQLLMM